MWYISNNTKLRLVTFISYTQRIFFLRALFLHFYSLIFFVDKHRLHLYTTSHPELKWEDVYNSCQQIQSFINTFNKFWIVKTLSNISDISLATFISNFFIHLRGRTRCINFFFKFSNNSRISIKDNCISILHTKLIIHKYHLVAYFFITLFDTMSVMKRKGGNWKPRLTFSSEEKCECTQKNLVKVTTFFLEVYLPVLFTS